MTESVKDTVKNWFLNLPGLRFHVDDWASATGSILVVMATGWEISSRVDLAAWRRYESSTSVTTSCQHCFHRL